VLTERIATIDGSMGDDNRWGLVTSTLNGENFMGHNRLSSSGIDYTEGCVLCDKVMLAEAMGVVPASASTPLLPDSIAAGRTITRPKVMVVIASAAMAKAARGVDGLYFFMASLRMYVAPLNGYEV
jgi:hypothetical protein